VRLAPKSSAVLGKRILTVKTGSIDSVRIRIRDVSLAVRGGEIIGLAGMEGSGQDLFSGLRGLVEPTGGNSAG